MRPRRQFWRALALAASSLFAPAGALGQVEDAGLASEIAATEALLTPWHGDDVPGLALSVMVDSEVVFGAGAGQAHLEHVSPMGPDTPVHAASVSKQFTAFSIALLAADDLIDLDADIRTYLPELQPGPEVVTVRHLLDHMGGYREQWTLFEMAGWSSSDVMTQAQQWRLLTRQTGRNFAPGARVEYSNSGYAMLARIVEEVSGQSFAAFTRTRVFEPLGMSSTHFRVDISDPVPGRALSYAPAGDGFVTQVYNAETTGSTGLVTTTADLLRWASNFETRRVGDTEVFNILAERTTAANGQPSVFGRGQELRRYHGLETWSHGGRDAGYRAFLLRVPSEGFAVSVLANRTDVDLAELAFTVLDIFLGAADGYRIDEPPAWQPASLPELESYAGHYEFFPGLIYTVSVSDGALRYAPRGGGQGEALQQIGPATFSADPAQSVSLRFRTGPEGRVVGLDQVVGLHGVIPAARIFLAPFDPAAVDLRAYTGIYYSPELDTRYELMVDDGVLVARNIRLSDTPLTPYQADTFAGTRTGMLRVRFERGADGVVTAALVSGPLAEEVRFDRIQMGPG